MKRLALVSLPFVLALAVVPAALAKGGEHGPGLGAEIRGPGLEEPIVLAANEAREASLAARIVETSGFVPAVHGSFPRAPGATSDPMLRTRPRGELGPRYTITYVVPAPRGRRERVVQYLYPFARLRPAPTVVPGQIVTYMPSGQRFGDERTRGGWYVATPLLKDDLVAAGLPASAPADGGRELLPPAAIATLAGLVLLGALAPILIRRRQARAVAT